MVVLATQNAPIQLNVPDPSGTVWALFAIVVVLLVAFLIAFAISLNGSTPEQRPAIIEKLTGWVRAVGDAVRPFRSRRSHQIRHHGHGRTSPPPIPASVPDATAELPEPPPPRPDQS